ncbi:MAG: hypothetical protein MUE46_02245 [Xanthomonadales bacterium]|jgi:hypothetical protein|nr:hypothetical protein [Xanthomonadales bacterium]
MPTAPSPILLQGAYITYAVYLGISILLTIWVARTLSASGEMFLIRCFGQDQELARSTNQLLVIGFYLINLGFVSIRLADWYPGTHSLVGELGYRIGMTLLVLGAMHFFNMLMIARLGRTVRSWIQTHGSSMPLPPSQSINTHGR